MEGAAATEVPATATTPLNLKSSTFAFVIEVAVTLPSVVDAPVENPAVNVPVYFPKLAATGLASVKVAEVVPETMLAKAAATSLAVMFTRAVKVRPLTVTKSLGLSALNAMTLVSKVESALPSDLVMPGMEFPLTISPTLPLLVAVAVTEAVLLAPVVKPSANVPLKLPLLNVAVVDAADTAKAVMPDFKLENAVANSSAEVAADAVKVSPFSVKPLPAASSAGKVIVVASLFPNALAAAPDTPVTPKGLEGGVVSKPKPKSEPCTEVESYQTDKFLPSGVVSVKPPAPLSPATTPCTVVPALILSITY